MDARLAAMGAFSDADFNSIHFEKRLFGLKDSQESINSCCHWCLENRHSHKKIVNAWLNVLKRVKVEQRLTLFYLANDVIQYSKRRNYEFVESWGTALQKATTMVRDEKVKHKILRIFKIWEQRGVYSEEFITDLCGLISASPTMRKGDEPHEFQPSYLISKIRNCTSLESDTDLKLKKLKEHNPKLQMDGESLIASLKDRAHVDDVERELEDYVKHIEAYMNSLKLEIKARTHLITLLSQADIQFDVDRKDVKLVASAYKTFGSRVKAFKKKLDDMMPSLSSPIPSPDIDAPSPSPDSDLEASNDCQDDVKSVVRQTIYTNAGYYNPVPPPNTDTTYSSGNNFSSFLGSNISFDLQNFSFGQTPNVPTTVPTNTQTTTTYNSNSSVSNVFPGIPNPPPPPVLGRSSSSDFSYSMPLAPPPMPPFNKNNGSYTGNSLDTNSSSYGSTPYDPANTNYQSTTVYDTTYPPPDTHFQPPSAFSTDTSYPPPTTSFQPPGSYPNSSVNSYSDEYNPEEELETWEPEASWEQPPPVELDTPESPPLFEKESYENPVEYHDSQNHGSAADVDHRILPALDSDIKHGHRSKDIDHRNLISLTGSPGDSSARSPSWITRGDQDYRMPRKSGPGGADQDYRVPFDIEQLKLPPPPPPPKSKHSFSPKTRPSPRRMQDNVESIDMELSDDEGEEGSIKENIRDNLKIIPLTAVNTSLEPPPPFPDFSDDADANNVLDDLVNELNNDEFPDIEHEEYDRMPPPGGMSEWNSGPHMGSNDMTFIPPPMMTPPPNTWIGDGFPFRGRGNGRGNFNVRGNDFRGRGWVPRGRGGNYFRGNRGQRNTNRGGRGRGNFRGNYRSGY